MIISKTPVRVSFFGGGSDYPDYYLQHGGAVLSTSIDKYIYISVRKMTGIFDVKYRIGYSKLELCNEVDEIQHTIVKACIKHLQIKDGLEIHIVSDLPARTGIGSSSACTVGMLNALHTFLGNSRTKHELALEAIYVEQVILNERVGVQDQLAAAHGGFNHITFSTENVLSVTPVELNVELRNMLQSRLMMFYTGIARFAHQVLEEQIQNIQQQKITPNMKEIKALVNKGLELLSSNNSLDKFGALMHETWLMKRGLSSAISNDFLDDIYQRALDGGALGGKLLGAGGGGFFVFYVPDSKQESVLEALHDLHQIPFKFEQEGTSIIYKS